MYKIKIFFLVNKLIGDRLASKALNINGLFFSRL